MEKSLEHLKGKESLSTDSNWKSQDSRFRKEDLKEELLIIIETVGVILLLTYAFYRRIWGIIPTIPMGIVYYRQEREKLCKKRLYRFELEFKECILSVAAALQAGYAIENAFLESCKDMKQLFGEDSVIYIELLRIRRGLVVNVSLEELLMELANRYESPVIIQFAEVFCIAKRSGGDMTDIIRSSAEAISAQIDGRAQMRSILSGREMEQTIMQLMPFGIMFYIGMANQGYFSSLYGNVLGIAVMSVCLVIYAAAYLIGQKTLLKLEQQI